MSHQSLKEAVEKFMAELTERSLRRVLKQVFKFLNQNPWPEKLTMGQAIDYSLMDQERLIKLAKEGRIQGEQDLECDRRSWTFSRASIDKYWEGIMGQKNGVD